MLENQKPNPKYSKIINRKV